MPPLLWLLCVRCKMKCPGFDNYWNRAQKVLCISTVAKNQLAYSLLLEYVQAILWPLFYIATFQFDTINGASGNLKNCNTESIESGPSNLTHYFVNLCSCFIENGQPTSPFIAANFNITARKCSTPLANFVFAQLFIHFHQCDESHPLQSLSTWKLNKLALGGSVQWVAPVIGSQGWALKRGLHIFISECRKRHVKQCGQQP